MVAMSRRILLSARSLQQRPRINRSLSTTSPRSDKDKKGDFKPEEVFKNPKSLGIESKDEFKEILKREDPFKRTAKILKNDMRYVGHKIKRFMGFEDDLSPDLKAQFFPTHTDVLVIGGGAIGSSIAYWLKQRAPHAMHVAVVEKDSTYTEASTCLSVGGLRQQFSLPENIMMSLFGAEFLRNVGKHLAVDDYPVPDVNFQPYGYLVLASEAGANTLKENSDLQRKLGARNILLSADRIKERFPWINTSGIELGCLGLEYEGWFDPWSLLNALKRKSINLGADFIEGAVVGFEFTDQPYISPPSKGGRYEQLSRAIIKLPDGKYQTITFGFCIIAAGAQSGSIGRMARMGEGEGLLSVPLPVEPRKRYVYVVDCPDGPGLNTPMVIDSSGAYFRREGLGSNFIAGMSPCTADEPPVDNLDVDYKFFDDKIWPILANRVPAFEGLKVKSGWAGFYEYNTMDENGIIGSHPYYHNLYIATGFSGHGIQHAPAVGRAIMELILDGEYKTIDLSRFGFERLCLGEPLHEKNCY